MSKNLKMMARMQDDIAALRARRIATSIAEPMVFTTLSDRIDSLYGALGVDAIEDVWEDSVSVHSRRGSKL